MRYCVRDALLSIKRHFGLFFLTFFTISTIFFLLGAVILVAANLHRISMQIESNLVINVYAKPFVSLSQIEILRKKVQSIPHVTKVETITKEMAYQQLKKALGTKGRFLDLIGGENPLPHSLRVWVDKAIYVATVAHVISSYPEVDEVIYAGRIIGKIYRAKQAINLFVFVFGGIIAVAVLLLVFNVIRISVYSRQEEIGIMLLVGATSSHIMAPFLLEGMIVSLLSAVFSSVILYFVYGYVVSRLVQIITFVEFITDKLMFLRLASILIGFGLLLGFLSSWVAVGSFLRAKAKPK